MSASCVSDRALFTDCDVVGLESSKPLVVGTLTDEIEWNVLLDWCQGIVNKDIRDDSDKQEDSNDGQSTEAA